MRSCSLVWVSGLRVMPQRVKKSVRFLLAMAEAVREITNNIYAMAIQTSDGKQNTFTSRLEASNKYAATEAVRATLSS